MGIDAKDVGILFWKILRFSTNTVYTYVRKYPIASGVSMVIFLLYTFLPSLFYLMLYVSPFIACSAFYLRNHLSFKPLNNKSIKTVNESSSPSLRKRFEGGTRKADLKHQRSVRRNARRKVEEVGKDWDSSQASEDERDKVILTTLYGEFPNAKRSPKIPKFKKERAFLASEEFSFEPSLDEETSLTTLVDPSEMLTSGGGETEIDCSSSSSSEGEEETSREDKKVVAWTEDDQKNLMDLGNSEMERNKRLEHLISRRRTRRLFLLAAEKSLMDMEVPSICVGRNFFGLDQENYEIDGLQMPESAPSVLLPRRNPFDLLYDPQEEKPNLSGDSFQQEFSEANPNDIFFCHHESFCRRIFPSEIQLDSKLEPWEKSVDGWPRPRQGSNDRLDGEKQLLKKEKDVTRAEGNDMESEHKTEIVVNDSNSLLSPGEREMESYVSNQTDSSGTFGKRNDDHRVGSSLLGLVPRNSGSLSSSLASERQRYMEHFGYSSRKGHKVSHSAESDLQVEVSETGSPPTTVDGNNSSESDENLLGFSDEENEAKEKSVVDKTAEPRMLPVEKVDQDFDETSSIICSEADVAKQFEGLSDGTDVNGRSEEDERSKSTHSLLENSDRGSHTSKEAAVLHTKEVTSQREEESQEMKTSYDSEEHFRENEEGETSHEMQEIVEAEALDVNDVAKQFEELSDGTYANGRSEEDERPKSRHSLLENSDRGWHICEEDTVPHTNEVLSKSEEESQEMRISYDSDEHEPEPSERRTDEEHFRGDNEGGISQEMQGIVEAEASDVNDVTSDESANSPRSVLPEMSLPLDQTFTFTSENLELTADSQPESPQNQFGGYSRNSREAEGQSESIEEATEEDSTSDAIVPLVHT